ncbi:MAG: low temperature requirement protein A [Actinomycetota bacterium]
MRDFEVEDRKSTWLELFFDLCFVAAVTALADGLRSDPTLAGLWHFCLLFVPVWWAWMEFTWFATAWDNDDLFHRLSLLFAMLLVIVLASGIRDVVSGGSDVAFVLAYAAMQVLLVVMFLRVLPHAGDARGLAKNYLIGDAIGGALMLASLAVDASARHWIWALALLVLMVAPVFAVRAYDGQPFDARHIPERYGLFAIIVLGEGVVAVTTGLSSATLDGGSVASALLGFGIAAAIWWAYFETVSSSALSRERVVASFLWGYGHLFAYSGIAASAVGVQLAIEAGAHGDHGLSLATRLMLCAGPGFVLFALAVIHKANIQAWDAVMSQRLIAIALLLATVGLGRGMPPAALTGVVFVVLAVTVTLDVRRAGGEGLAAEQGPDTAELSTP